jgi:sarcosine oxidase
VAALQQRAAAHGADVRFGVGPASVSPTGDGAEVHAGEESWRSPVVVLTVGGWTSLPDMRVTREQVQHFAPLSGGTDWPSFIHHRTPWVYGLFDAHAGMKVAEHHVGPETDPDVEDALADPVLLQRVVRYAERWFPGVDPEPVHVSRCIYTTTPDESFVLERHGPIVIGSPCSGHGFKFTPLIGRRLADLAMA